MTTQSGGYRLTFHTTREAGALLESRLRQEQRSGICVSQGNLFEELSQVQALPQNDSGERGFAAQLSTVGWTEAPVNISGELERRSYGACIPLSALHQDSRGYFVFVCRREQTILGIRNLAVRIDVTVEDRDGSFAAVTSPELDYGEEIICGSSKPLHDGDRVRVEP